MGKRWKVGCEEDRNKVRTPHVCWNDLHATGAGSLKLSWLYNHTTPFIFCVLPVTIFGLLVE